MSEAVMSQTAISQTAIGQGLQTPWSDQPWRRAVVYGLGLSGQAATRFLRRRGVRVVAYDQRSEAGEMLAELAHDPGVDLRLGAEPRRPPQGIDGVVVSPGVPMNRPLLQAARRRGIPVIAEVELAFPFLAGPVVAITGSNGKSTTTAMTGAMLQAGGFQAEVCGNIGKPLCAVVDGAPGRVFVVELSSFQLEAVDHFHPTAAALLNLSPDHLDRHTNFASYRTAKSAIFMRQSRADLAVLGASDPWLAALKAPGRRRFFTSRGEVADGCQKDADMVVEVAPGAPPQALFHLDDVPLPGPHNLENAMAAALLARHHGVTAENIGLALRSFRGLPHRLERVRKLEGVVWYDDSKGTNLAATVCSLESFADRAVHLILGGRFKGGDLTELGGVVARKACRVLFIGEAAETLASGLASSLESAQLEPELLGTLEAAVARTAQRAQEGEVVLLSPACSSFDQFANFAARGLEFQRLVKNLPRDPTHGA